MDKSRGISTIDVTRKKRVASATWLCHAARRMLGPLPKPPAICPHAALFETHSHRNPPDQIVSEIIHMVRSNSARPPSNIRPVAR